MPEVADNEFNVFLSHVWGTGQDQMRVVKQRLVEMLPDIRCFLDETGWFNLHEQFSPRREPSQSLLNFGIPAAVMNRFWNPAAVIIRFEIPATAFNRVWNPRRGHIFFVFFVFFDILTILTFCQFLLQAVGVYSWDNFFISFLLEALPLNELGHDSWPYHWATRREIITFRPSDRPRASWQSQMQLQL